MSVNKGLNWLLDLAEEEIGKSEFLFTPETRVCLKHSQNICFGKIKKIKRRWGELKIYIVWDAPVSHALSLDFLGYYPVLPATQIGDSFLLQF